MDQVTKKPLHLPQYEKLIALASKNLEFDRPSK